MKACPEEFKLFEYAENELSAQEAAAIARHIETCESCRCAVAAMRISHAALAAVAPVSPPQDLLQVIQGAVDKRAEGITCGSAHELISASLDSELTLAEANLLDAHLKDCADCRYFAERMGLLTSAIRSIPDVAPVPGLKARIEAAVDRAAGVGNIFRRRFTRRIASFAGIAAAAALLVAVVLNSATISGIAVAPESPAPQVIATAPITPEDNTVAPAPDTMKTDEATSSPVPDENIATPTTTPTVTAPTGVKPVRHILTPRPRQLASTTDVAPQQPEAPAVTPPSAPVPAPAAITDMQPTPPAVVAVRPPVNTTPAEIKPTPNVAPRPTVTTPAAPRPAASTPRPAPTPAAPAPVIARATPDIHVELPNVEKKAPSFVPMRVASTGVSDAPVHIVKTSYVPVREATSHSVALSGNSLANHLAESRERVSKKADAMASSATDGKIVIIK